MSKETAQFVYMTCRAGAENALKREVARAMPAWHVAFSRPGFLTFKHTGERPLDVRQLAERSWTLAHAHGLSLGQVRGDSLAWLVEQVWNHEGVSALAADQPVVDIHVWQREPASSDDDGAGGYVTPLSQEIEQALRSAAPATFARLHKPPAERRSPTKRGGLVLDVVVVEPGEWWIGCHRAVTLAERWPGGVIPVVLPPHAVSRAYAKLDEAILWSGLPLAEGDECVEIGCAPGGASQALLDRGLFVTGIDPATVDPVVLAHPRFRYLRKRGKEVQRKEFTGVRWLVADMNIVPAATLDTVESIVTHPGLTIRGLVLTLKLSDWHEADQLQDFAARARSWGFRDVRIRQLTSGGQEVCLVALRRKALRRLGRKTSRAQATSHKRQRSGDRQGRRRRTAATPGHERHDKPHESPAGPHF